MERKQTRPTQWAILVAVTVAGAWAVYVVGALALDSTLAGSLGVVRLLVAAYVALAAGYLFSALATRLAPRRRYHVAVGLVFAAVLVAAALMLRESSEEGPLAAVLVGTSLVVGSFGNALRIRGFTEAITGREP